MQRHALRKRRRGRIPFAGTGPAATIGPCSSPRPRRPSCLPRQPTAARHPRPGRSPSASFAMRSRSSRPASRSIARAALRRPLRRLYRELVQLGLARPAARRVEPRAGARRASPRTRTRERYAINVLAHDQVELARRFSRPHADRFEGVAFRLGAADAPLIEGCVAWFECRHHAVHRTGDHVLFIGEVETCERRSGSGTRVPPRPLQRDAQLADGPLAERARWSGRQAPALFCWKIACIARKMRPRNAARERLAVERRHGEHLLRRRRQPHLVGGERLGFRHRRASRTAIPPRARTPRSRRR